MIFLCTKFHQNPSKGLGGVTKTKSRGQTDRLTDGQTDGPTKGMLSDSNLCDIFPDFLVTVLSILTNMELCDNNTFLSDLSPNFN